MLTKKGKYGLKALVHLSYLPAGQLAFVGDIATQNSIPKKFLDAILGELRNAGFVVPENAISYPYLWWSRADLGILERWFGIQPPADREETLLNLVAVKPR